MYINSKNIKDYENPWIFSECTKKTKLVVFEKIKDLSELESYYSIISGSITVNRKNENINFEIKPRLMFICESEIKKEQVLELGESFHRRFSVKFYKSNELYSFLYKIINNIGDIITKNN